MHKLLRPPMANKTVSLMPTPNQTEETSILQSFWAMSMFAANISSSWTYLSANVERPGKTANYPLLPDER